MKGYVSSNGMKKHLAVIVPVCLLLLGVYLVGKPQHTAAPAASSGHQTTKRPVQPVDTTSQPPAFDKAKYSLTDPTSLWVVVNKQRRLSPTDYAPSDLVAVGNGQRMRAQAAAALTQMFTAAKTAGFSLVAQSAYRSYATQVNTYNSEVKAYGQAQADTESARPGYSEHQTGWAVDIGAPGCYLDCFGTKPGSQWLLANAYKYGFVLRYPADKTAITGYRNEPWHFRYVGVDLATEMQKQKITTLEEFFSLPAAPNYP